jgi:hypothetical protein
MHTHERHAHEMHAHEMHAHETPAHETPIVACEQTGVDEMVVEALLIATYSTWVMS